ACARQGEDQGSLVCWTSTKKMSSATGGRAPLLPREEGSSLVVGTTPGEACPEAAGVGDPLAITTNGGRRGDPRPQCPAATVKAIGGNPELGTRPTPAWASANSAIQRHGKTQHRYASIRRTVHRCSRPIRNHGH